MERMRLNHQTSSISCSKGKVLLGRGGYRVYGRPCVFLMPLSRVRVITWMHQAVYHRLMPFIHSFIQSFPLLIPLAGQSSDYTWLPWCLRERMHLITSRLILATQYSVLMLNPQQKNLCLWFHSVPSLWRGLHRTHIRILVWWLYSSLQTDKQALF